MKIKTILFLLLYSMLTTWSNAQSIIVPESLGKAIAQEKKVKITSALNELFSQINDASVKSEILGKENPDLTARMFAFLRDKEVYKDQDTFYQKKLIRFYNLSENTYALSIAYLGSDAATAPTLRIIYNLIAEEIDGKILFNIPLWHLTKNWKSQTVGNINYIYPIAIQIDRAKIFDQKNTIIAKKLEVEPEKFTFYMCQNYQEILRLLGYEYDIDEENKIRDGYGIVDGYIFSIMNNEDFAHDVYHYYSSKVNPGLARNWITEEGIAYLWGNAYYTDPNGDMIEQKDMIRALKKYLNENPDTSLYDLFESNAKVFPDLAPEASARSTISGIICDEIEKTQGIKVLMKLNNCGRMKKVESYLKVTDEFLSINKDNFNVEVKKLLDKR